MKRSIRYRLIQETFDPFYFLCHESYYFTRFSFGFSCKILILTWKSISRVEQFYLFPLIPTGAVLSVPFKNKWSSSIFSDAHSMAQFYLFRGRLGGAVLSVMTHKRWCSSICSEAYSMKQFYLFRSTINGAILFVPLISYWNCSKCSLPIIW